VSSALAIAGVTAVLRDLLNNGLIDHSVSGTLGNAVTVSALAPDRIIASNGVEPTQLNLFLYHVTPNQGWRNERLPSRDSAGRTRLSNPPLALDLHYLLSAYGSEDLHADILLGYAMQLLHETPVLGRSAITTALNPSPPLGTALPPALQALAECGLADQLEQIKITPEYLNTEEVSKLWTAVQSHYRPTAAYVATVVLIESTLPARAALPVLSRGPVVDLVSGRDRGVVVEPSLLAPLPTIQSVVPRSLDPVATVGGGVDINGHHLDGAGATVLLTNDRFQPEQEVAVDEGASSATASFTVPDLPVGFYQVALRVIRPGDSDSRTSNQLGLIIGPEITTPSPLDVARDGAGTATITLDFHPQARPGQSVSLLLGTRETLAGPIGAATGTLTFVVEDAPTGDQLLRLRVDGVESPIIDRLAKPPVFLDHLVKIT
jgi:Pvc16 N-terminal domain